jgi:carbon starvation protein CstA
MIGVREWLWILFAGANQLLAALVLMFATIWLTGQKKAILWTFIPSVFLFLTGLTAIFYSSVYQPFLKEIVTSASIYDLITIRSITSLAFAIFFSTIAAYIYIIGLNKLIGARMKNS